MNSPLRLWPLVPLTALIVLHFNFWMWDDDTIVWGFPSNLFYHVGLCLLASVAMFAVVRFAWPHELDQDES